MRLLQNVLHSLKKTKKPQYKFVTHLLGLMLMLPGHATFRNMSRYSPYHERTFSRWYARDFDWVSLNQAANLEPEGARVEVGDLEVIADIEAGSWHDHAADQRRNRRLAVERMRTMDHQAGVNSLLAGFFGIQGRHELANRHQRGATATGYYAGASRGRVDIQAASQLERPHEFTKAAFVLRFNDKIQGVFTLHDSFALNLQPMLPYVWPA